jgi:hypothetical protein
MEEIISLNTFVLFVFFLFVALPEEKEKSLEKEKHHITSVIDGIVIRLSESERDLAE